MTTAHPRGPRRPSEGARTSRPAGVALLVGAIVVLSGCSSPAAVAPTTSPPSAAPPASASPRAPTAPVEAVAPALPPASVGIPSIALTAPLIDLGLATDGGMEVPADYDEVGWFTGGGRPGGRGPLVIAAHVDSPTGPAAFIRLAELVPGDRVEVTDAGGTVFRYRVTEAVDYPKSDFPTARVFGATSADELRLITCGGVFDRSRSSYTDNRVVYAVRE